MPASKTAPLSKTRAALSSIAMLNEDQSSSTEVKYEGNIPRRWGNLSAEELVFRFWQGTVAGTYVGHGETYLHPSDVLWWSKAQFFAVKARLASPSFARSSKTARPKASTQSTNGKIPNTVASRANTISSISVRRSPHPGNSSCQNRLKEKVFLKMA